MAWYQHVYAFVMIGDCSMWLYVILLGCKLQGAYPYFHDFFGQQPAIVMPADDRLLSTTICCCFARTTWNTMM